MTRLSSKVSAAVKRCKLFAFTIFIAYSLSCLTGILMSHAGNHFAVSHRDNIVGKAMKSDKASINYQEGKNFSAAIYDFMGNLFFGAIPQTVMGFSIVIPYFFVLKQGWAGGIVSIDSEHKSRFRNFKSAFYYFLVLLLQLIPYSLAIGAGIKCGTDFYKYNRINGWHLSKFKIQKNSLMDLGYVYILVVPLFFIASCFEFMSSWNV
jgi:hypothetical protein